MSFSLLKKFDTKVKTIIPLGLDTRGENINYMTESLNLEYDDRCAVRSSRKLLFPFTEEPDQVITCGERIFLRYVNNIYEIIKENGSLTLGPQIGLTQLSTAPDRTVIDFEDKLYIFPDQLIVEQGNEPWIEFAPADSSLVKFPFIDAYGLFFTNGNDGGQICADASLLEVGCEIKFSWHSIKNFTIVKKEKVSVWENAEIIDMGTVFWLNAPVNNYNEVPENAFAHIRYPRVYKAPKVIYFGHGDRGVQFFGNVLNISNYSGEKTYTDTDITKNLFPGMIVKIEGSSKAENNTQAKITYVGDSTIIFDKNFESDSFQSGNFLKITPVVPTTDHATIIDNRLFIVNNESGKLSASRYGEPLIFCGNEKNENGSFELSLKKICTGLIEFKNQPHCFTPDGGFKIYENQPGEFFAANLQVGGIPAYSSKTLCAIKDKLLYFSDNGVMKYSGGTDSKISFEVKFSNPKSAVAVRDKYYILDEDMIYIYYADGQKWWAESGDGIKQLIIMEQQVCFVKREGIYIADELDYPVSWSLCSGELPENSYQKILPLGIKLFVNSKKGCELSVSIRFRGEKLFKNIFTGFIKDESVINIPCTLSWSNGFHLKLSGKGDAAIDKFIIRYRRRPI